jgi:cell shape-determining protein MreC
VHTSTKFLIVLCSLMAVLLAAMTITYASNADKIVDSVRSERLARAAAEAEARAAVSAATQEKVTLQETNAKLQNAMSAVESKIRDLESERATLRSDKEQAVSQAAAIRNRIDQLAATSQTQADVIKGYREQVLSLQSEQLSSSRREIELVDRLNDLESQREVLDQTARTLREQLAEAQQAVQAASGGAAVVAKDTSSGEPYEPKGLDVRARILDAFTSPAGQEMVLIDAGSNSGLRENMKLTIARDGGTFVANLIITKVDPRQAVGRVDKLGRTIDVQKGDMVFTQIK